MQAKLGSSNNVCCCELLDADQIWRFPFSRVIALLLLYRACGPWNDLLSKLHRT